MDESLCKALVLGCCFVIQCIVLLMVVFNMYCKCVVKLLYSWWFMLLWCCWMYPSWTLFPQAREWPLWGLGWEVSLHDSLFCPLFASFLGAIGKFGVLYSFHGIENNPPLYYIVLRREKLFLLCNKSCSCKCVVISFLLLRNMWIIYVLRDRHLHCICFTTLWACWFLYCM